MQFQAFITGTNSFGARFEPREAPKYSYVVNDIGQGVAVRVFCANIGMGFNINAAAHRDCRRQFTVGP